MGFFQVPTTLRPYTEQILNGVSVTVFPSSSLFGIELLRHVPFVSATLSQSVTGEMTGSMTGTLVGNLNGSPINASTSSYGIFSGSLVGCLTGSGLAIEVSSSTVWSVPKDSVSMDGVTLFDRLPLDGVTYYYRSRHVDDYGNGSTYTPAVGTTAKVYPSNTSYNNLLGLLAVTPNRPSVDWFGPIDSGWIVSGSLNDQITGATYNWFYRKVGETFTQSLHTTNKPACFIDDAAASASNYTPGNLGGVYRYSMEFQYEVFVGSIRVGTSPVSWQIPFTS